VTSAASVAISPPVFDPIVTYGIGGIAVLVAVLWVFVATSPMVRMFGDSPEHINSWVLYFLYVWLPVVLVTVAIAGHVVIWRKLLAETYS
jgi:small-conductance mechanosensitive channel